MKLAMSFPPLAFQGALPQIQMIYTKRFAALMLKKMLCI
nr:MAG TPA: hypothetical protein [Caudoviricetes sp.]